MPEGFAHPFSPAVSFDGGDLDCGSGLLLLIRRHIDPLARGQLLEILSRESSVAEDLPSWCRLTGNELVSMSESGKERRFLVSKGPFRAPAANGGSGESPPGVANPSPRRPAPLTEPVVRVTIPTSLPSPSPAPPVPPLAAGGIGSWPRPRWMLDALHAHLEGRLDEDAFQETADDAVRLAVADQLSAGAAIVTDGEQRRDNYASFVAGRLDNCQLIPITDLLPYVEDADEFEKELRALDVPAGDVRHPAVFGPLGRSRPLAVHELRLLAGLAGVAATKVALPGPYLLTRTMWMECISDRAYATREDLATDIVRVLREEIADLLAAGASLVQLDEPVLTEVVFSDDRPAGGRSFMCGALGARRETGEELSFALDLLKAVTSGFPEERLAMHVCRGNWTPDESVALAGDYRPLLPLLAAVPVGTLFLELCTPRAGELEVLRTLPSRLRIGVGVINQKDQRIETEAEVEARAERAIAMFGAQRVLLNTDCGFATFADNPIVASKLAKEKLSILSAVSRRLRERHHCA